MTDAESTTQLELEIDELTETAFALGADKLDPLILRGWREMAVGALKSLVSGFQTEHLESSYKDILDKSSDSLDNACIGALFDSVDSDGPDDDENGIKYVDSATALVAVAYARLAHLEQKRRDEQTARLKEMTTIALENGVTPIGVTVDGAMKGQLVAVQIGGNFKSVDIPTFTSTAEYNRYRGWSTQCNPGCKFAKWRTDGKPSTEPGYSARCDECKTQVSRPGYAADNGPYAVCVDGLTWINGEAVPATKKETTSVQESKCCGKCKCSHDVLYK
jgi:hypothetical protein